jgi:glycerol-3-phosphate cytidylyltransferase
MIIGYASGVYDLYHIGHLNILRRARLRTDFLIAGVTSDPEVLRLKGHPAHQTQEERQRIIGAVRHVDQAYIDPHATDKTLAWDELRFHVIFKGSDWVGTPKGIELERAMSERGVEVVYLPYTASISSTTLRGRLDTSSPR